MAVPVCAPARGSAGRHALRKPVGPHLRRRIAPTAEPRARWQNARGASKGTQQAAAPRPRRHRAQLRTYIVEDNATIRENLIGALEELASIQPLGWAETEGDAKAWFTAHATQWDLAIVDLFLKQGSGLGVLEACRKRGDGQRVVVLSNYATAEMRERCLELGADAVFDKSREIDALVDYCMAQGA